MDKSWMKLKDRVSDEYRVGVNAFIEFATATVGLNGKIRCPCVNCMNISYLDINIVKYHLLLRGMSTTYTTWLHHGEDVAASSSNLKNVIMNDDGDDFQDRMTTNERENNDELQGNGNEFFDMLEEIYFENLRNDHDTEESLDDIEVEDVQNFDQLLHDARRELYPGCKEYSVLSFVITIMHAKVMFKWSNKSVDYLLNILKKLLPNCNEKVPWTVYEAKKLLRDLGLGYECIDACKFDCVLFWKDNASLDKCPVCKAPRYKPQGKNGKKIAHKVLRYFPLTPRLKRLYMSRKTASDMRWHKEKRVDDGISRHPADGDEWKNFDRTHPEFARESRNVRLGLATDGFNPFGSMSISYSIWPIMVTPYNLPPWKCMKEQFCMMSLLIPGPSAPGRNIDVYMRPLIDELKDLWENGVYTYDALSRCHFQMRAAIMWTINDFPAYGNLSGWTTKGYMACPNCNEEHSTQSLRGKIGYMGARRFLPEDHAWRRSKLFDGKVENRPRPRVLTGEQIFEQVSAGTYEPCGKHPNNLKRQKLMSNFERSIIKKSNLNWNKQSILFELPYWKTLNLRHNLDVMHIEKNICDSLIGTLLSIHGKNKDTPKARMDLKDMKIRKTLHCKERPDGKLVMPPALYTLSPQERQMFLDFLQSIKYPDGYAANISKCVNTRDGRLLGLKSHDCHILLQKILPIGMRGCLSKDICIPLFELGNFFQELCAKTLNISQFEKIEEHIVLILCKLEKIFPPAFFDVMVHLPIHLPHEAKLGGPVQYRWMYPIERFLGTLKKFVTNRARPEGSIAEAYVVKECLAFCSMYLDETETVYNREERNVDGGDRGPGLAVFTQSVRPILPMYRPLDISIKEREMAHWFVLYNSSEIDPYLEEHKRILETESTRDIMKRHVALFPNWFKCRMNHLRSKGSPEATDELWSLANGPNPIINLYSGCISNGVRFHTKDLENRRRSQNSGVIVEGDHGGQTHDFYGFLCKVWEMRYMFNHHVVLLQCEWFDTGSSKTICSNTHCTTIDTGSRWYKDDPFVLPNQVKQVFYVNDTKLGGNWKVVQHIERRGIWDIPEITSEEIHNDEIGDVFQQDETTDIPPIVTEDQIGDELCRTDIEAEIVQNDIINTERRARDEPCGLDNFICDEDEDFLGMEHSVDEDEFHYDSESEGDSESSNDYDVEP